jgi:hypothetical protein
MVRPVLTLERLLFLEQEEKVGYRHGPDGRRRARAEGLPGVHRPGRLPYSRQGPGHGPLLWALRQRPPGQSQESQPCPVLLGLVEENPPPLPSKGWAEMVRKVYEVDLRICPRCGGRTKVVAFLTEPAVVDRIIRHLGLTVVAEKPPPPMSSSQWPWRRQSSDLRTGVRSRKEILPTSSSSIP